MDWVLLRDGTDGSDSDGGGSSVQVSGGSDSASEDGSDSGFAIVRVRKDHRRARTASQDVDGAVVASDKPPAMAAAAAVPLPAPPGFFKVVSEVGEHDGAGTSCGVEEVEAESFGEEDDEEDMECSCCNEEEDTEDSGEEENNDDNSESSGQEEEDNDENSCDCDICEEDDDESSGEEDDMENSGESSGEEDAEISGEEEEEEEEEEEDGLDESSSEDCFEIPATRHPGREATARRYTYEDVDDESDEDESKHGYIDNMRTYNVELATAMYFPLRMYDGIDTDNNNSDEDDGIEDSYVEESTKRSGRLVSRGYDDVDSGSDVEESASVAYALNDDTEARAILRVYRPLSEFFFERAVRALFPQVRLAQLAERVCRSYDGIDSGSDEDGGIEGSGVEEESAKPSEFVGRSYDDVDSGSDVEESASVAYALNNTETRAMFRAYRYRPFSECLLERAARDLSEVRLAQLSGCVCRSCDDIDGGCSDVEESDCQEEEEEEEEEEYEEEEEDDEEDDDDDEEEEEESCCEDEDDIDCPEEDDSDDDIDTSDSETDESDRNSTTSSEESDDDDDNDTVHDVCGQCGHVVQTSKRPVELGSISDYDCFDPEAVVRPARVICKNGKPIYIVYDDDEVSGTDGDEEEVSDTAGAEILARGSAGSRAPAAEAHSTAQAERNKEPTVKDLLLEIVEEFESARLEHGGVDRRGAPLSGGGGGIGVEAVSHGVPGASSSTRGAAGGLAAARAERERELVLEDLKRRAVMAEDTLELEDLLQEMLEEFEAAQPEHGGVDRRGVPGSGGIGVEEASHGATGAGPSSSARDPAGGLAAARAARERDWAAVVEEMERRKAALQGWRDASRRVVAEYGAPPAQVQERAGQRGEGSPTVDITFSAMVYLIVCLASICFRNLRSS